MEISNSYKVSIVVPVFNAARFLKDTITSILNQSYDNIEVILVNDGSTDDSQKIIDYFKSIDSRVQSITTDNMGAPHARNEGLNLSNGDYVIFFDADDVMLHGEIMSLISGLDNDVDLVIGSRSKITESGVRFRDDKLVDGIFDPRSSDIEYLMGLSPFPDNKLYSTELLKKNGIRFCDVRIAQDYNIYIKYLSVCRKVRTISDSVCLYRVVNNSISRTYSDKIIDIIKCELDIAKYVYSKTNNTLFINSMKDSFVSHCLGQMNKIEHIRDKKLKRRIITRIGRFALSISKSKGYNAGSQASKDIIRIMKMIKHRGFYSSHIYEIYRKFFQIVRGGCIELFIKLRSFI